MRLLESFFQKGLSLAVGNFDGLHLGHQALLKEAAKYGPFGALSFSPHPREFFQNSSANFLLMSHEDKRIEIQNLGGEGLWHIVFDELLAEQSPEAFMLALVRTLEPSALVVGEDFRFGKGRTGDPAFLCDWGRAYDLSVSVVPLLHLDGKKISSSRIRHALDIGDVKQAETLLGRAYYFRGQVQQGDQRGRELGMPTANLYPKNIMLPKFGIYASFVEILTGPYKGIYKGASSLGVRPHFGENTPNFESYILDFEGDIYGESIRVELVEYLRPEAKFDSLDALIMQMHADVEIARATLLADGRYA